VGSTSCSTWELHFPDNGQRRKKFLYYQVLDAPTSKTACDSQHEQLATQVARKATLFRIEPLPEQARQVKLSIDMCKIEK